MVAMANGTKIQLGVTSAMRCCTSGQVATTSGVAVK